MGIRKISLSFLIINLLNISLTIFMISVYITIKEQKLIGVFSERVPVHLLVFFYLILTALEHLALGLFLCLFLRSGLICQGNLKSHVPIQAAQN